MKKRFFSTGLVLLLVLTSAMMLSGCSSDKMYDYDDLSEYVTVGEYKGLEYEKISVSVSDKEIQEEIDSRLQAAATTESVETGTVESGDVVDISYEGTVEGVEGEDAEGLSSDNYSLTIGSGSFISGFEDGLIGKEVGSTVTLDLTFPDPYETNEELSGKDVTFVVTINSKQVETVPEYDLDFVKANSDYDNLEDYEASVKEDLLEEKTSEAEASRKQTLWQQVVDASEVKDYPETELNTIIENETNGLKETAESQGYEWEDYLEAIGYSEEDLASTIEEYAKEKVFQDLITYYIAAQEGLEVTDEEYEEYIDNIISSSGLTDETFEQYYGMTIEEYAELNSWRSNMLLNKVADKIIEYGTEVDG